jgi:hypothetical protein
MSIVYGKNFSSTVDIKIIFGACRPKRWKTSKHPRGNRGKDFQIFPLVTNSLTLTMSGSARAWHPRNVMRFLALAILTNSSN